MLSAKIITYNRAEDLRNTLRSWNSGQLRSIKLEILNNASTDHTLEVIFEACAENPNITCYNQKENIGAVGNLLCAYKRFDTDYCWLLCDDDCIHGQHYELIKNAISTRSDVILTSSVGSRTQDYGFTGSIEEFRRTGGRFYFMASFLPGMIFRRTFLEQGIISKCFQASDTLYPHAALIEGLANAGATITVLKKPVVERLNKRDSENSRTNWIIAVLLPCKYMPKNGIHWAFDFIEAMELSKFKIAAHMALHYRRVGLYSYSDYISIKHWISKPHQLLKFILFFTSFTPKWTINLARSFR
jgi:glycosyltransferase involved in cell wall biosynthesis